MSVDGHVVARERLPAHVRLWLLLLLHVWRLLVEPKLPSNSIVYWWLDGEIAVEGHPVRENVLGRGWSWRRGYLSQLAVLLLLLGEPRGGSVEGLHVLLVLLLLLLLLLLLIWVDVIGLCGGGPR